jgi:peptidoglycan/LPS O-acetylase OafA/YrhL
MTRIDGEIRSLVGVRAFAAVLVVAFHLHVTLTQLAPGAEPGVKVLNVAADRAVDFFFMLSGFIITERYLVDLAKPSWHRIRHFLILRFARIWPVHATVVVAFLVWDWLSHRLGSQGLSDVDVGASNTLLNILMLHQVPPGTPINLPAWSIGVEFGAYLLFPIAAMVLIRFRTAIAAFGAAAFVLVAGALLVVRLASTLEPDAAYYAIPWSRAVLGFIGGCLLNIGWRALRTRQYGSGWDVVILIATPAAAVAALLADRLTGFFLTFPLVGLLVLASAGATGHIGRVFGSRPVAWCGRLSFSLYMTHFLVILVANPVLSRVGAASFGAPVRTLLGLVVVVIIAVAAVATYFGLEEPARRAIRRWERAGEVSTAPVPRP